MKVKPIAKSHLLRMPFVLISDPELLQPVLTEAFKDYVKSPRAQRLTRMNNFPAFIPFSTGPRTRIRMHFALMKSLILLHKILSRYELAMDAIPNRVDPYVTLRPGVPISTTFRLAVREPAL